MKCPVLLICLVVCGYQHTKQHYTTLQHNTTQYNAIQYTTTHYNTAQQVKTKQNTTKHAVSSAGNVLLIFNYNNSFLITLISDFVPDVDSFFLSFFLSFLFFFYTVCLLISFTASHHSPFYSDTIRLFVCTNSCISYVLCRNIAFPFHLKIPI